MSHINVSFSFCYAPIFILRVNNNAFLGIPLHADTFFMNVALSFMSIRLNVDILVFFVTQGCRNLFHAELNTATVLFQDAIAIYCRIKVLSVSFTNSQVLSPQKLKDRQLLFLLQAAAHFDAIFTSMVSKGFLANEFLVMRQFGPNTKFGPETDSDQRQIRTKNKFGPKF